MSLNKGKAKAKPSKKTTAKTAGTKKKAVMNRRKYNEAISGDTMSNYAMYRRGGKVKKYEPGGEKETYADRIVKRIAQDDSTVGNYVIKPAAKALFTGVKKTAEFIEKAKPAIKAGMKRLTDEDVRKPVGGYKKGGATKTKKFAALAPPYNKVTFADKIAGAKKRSKKK